MNNQNLKEEIIVKVSNCMAMQSCSLSLCCYIYIFILVFKLVPFKPAFAHSAIEFLPGFEGSLPFQLETGYVGVGESESVQLFYYFVKSERNPGNDPIMLWLTGGPGCSAFSGLVYEIGPLNFKVIDYNGRLPELVLNPFSWTKVSNIIFVDAPVGTGFSYAKTEPALQSGDFIQVHQLSQFLRKWLACHAEFLSNPVYIGGDSYSGITVPILVEEIINGNEEGQKPGINLKGYLLGNALTDPVINQNSVIPYAHGMGLISDELYESLQRTCKGNYQYTDPTRSPECSKDLQYYYECISGIQQAQILEPLCGFASPKPTEMLRGRSLDESLRFSIAEPNDIDLSCRTYGYTLSTRWINDPRVREALHVRNGSVDLWQRCSFGLKYTRDVASSYQYHVNLSKKGLRSLIYNGDHDMIVPFLGTQAWIRSLNYSIVDDWRRWMAEGQVGGYTRTYANQMTFATVKGGGHTAPEYRPKEAFYMYKRWISEEPL